MPPQKSKKQTASGNRGSLPSFVTVDMTEEDWAMVRNDAFPAATAMQFFHDATVAHLKVSISYDLSNSSFLCSVTRPADGPAIEGLCLVSRGPSISEAVAVAAYKMHAKLDWDWDRVQNQPSRGVWS